MVSLLPSWFRQLINRPHPASPSSKGLATHYVVWNQPDSTGMASTYVSQHMARAQALDVAEIKQREGAAGIRIQRVL